MTTAQVNDAIDSIVKKVSWAELNPTPDHFIQIRQQLNELRQVIDDAIANEVTETLVTLASSDIRTLGADKQKPSVVEEHRLPSSQKLG